MNPPLINCIQSFDLYLDEDVGLGVRVVELGAADLVRQLRREVPQQRLLAVPELQVLELGGGCDDLDEPPDLGLVVE